MNNDVHSEKNHLSQDSYESSSPSLRTTPPSAQGLRAPVVEIVCRVKGGGKHEDK